MNDQPTRLSRANRWTLRATATIMLALAGCDKGRSSESVGANEAAPRPAFADGMWEISTTTLPRPGEPLPEPRVMQPHIDGGADRFPPAHFFADARDGCDERGVRIADGRISGAIVCAAEGNRGTRYQLNGTYSERQFQVTVDIVQDGTTTRLERRGRFIRR